MSRFLVGIDLGTTNSALAYIDLQNRPRVGNLGLKTFSIPQLIAAGQQFDLILADPPYGEKNVGRRSTSLAQRLVDVPELPKLLAPGGRFVLGHARRDTLEIPKWWAEAKVMKHGDNMMRFLEAV